MQVAATIAELNPLHAGHLYLMQKIRPNCDLFVIILSGYYSQRGLPSMLTPEQKTRLALMSGADIVCELPALYAAQSAWHFARASIESLAVLGVTDLYFGSESFEISRLEKIADDLDGLEKQAHQSIRTSLQQLYGDLKSNDILGLCYIYFARKYGMNCHLIKRQPFFASATSIRQRYFSDSPQTIRSLLYHKQSWKDLYPYLRLYLVMSPAERLSQFHLVEEGIEHRLKEMAKAENMWEDFLEACITKGYSRARIQRTCLMILLQIEKKTLKEHEHFDKALILGLSGKGRKWLKEHPSPDILVRLRDYPEFLLNVHNKCVFLYNLGQSTSNRKILIYETEKHKT